MNFKIVASFVHAYNDLEYKVEKENLPALLINDLLIKHQFIIIHFQETLQIFMITKV